MKFTTKILFFLFLFISHLNGISQGCSTCRAQIINSSNNDFTVGNGLNIGILFLMTIPYIILFFLFRKKLFNIYKSFKTDS